MMTIAEGQRNLRSTNTNERAARPPRHGAEGTAADLIPMIPMHTTGKAGMENVMSVEMEVVRSTLMAMGFAAERVDAAVVALSGARNEKDEDGIGDEPLLTAAELRARLKVSATSLWRMKDLPFVKVGGRRRFLWSEVRRHFAEPGTEGRRA